MVEKKNNLDSIELIKQCTADWERMVGNDRSRYCSECQRTVYNLSAMDREEAEGLVANSEGRLCLRISRLADGSVVTRIDDEGSLSERVTLGPNSGFPSRLSAAAAAGVIALTLAPIANISAVASSRVRQSTVAARSGKTSPREEPKSSVGGLHGTVSDINQARIVTATLTLEDGHGGKKQTKVSADDGTYEFSSLAPGHYHLKAEAPGFQTFTVDNVVVAENQRQVLDITMKVAVLMGEVITPKSIIATPSPLEVKIEPEFSPPEPVGCALIGREIRSDCSRARCALVALAKAVPFRSARWLRGRLIPAKQPNRVEVPPCFRIQIPQGPLMERRLRGPKISRQVARKNKSGTTAAV